MYQQRQLWQTFSLTIDNLNLAGSRVTATLLLQPVQVCCAQNHSPLWVPFLPYVTSHVFILPEGKMFTYSSYRITSQHRSHRVLWFCQNTPVPCTFLLRSTYCHILSLLQSDSKPKSFQLHLAPINVCQEKKLSWTLPLMCGNLYLLHKRQQIMVFF